jgi:hypothetical protein
METQYDEFASGVQILLIRAMETVRSSYIDLLGREYLSLPDICKRMAKCAGEGFDPVVMRCRLRLAHSRLESASHCVLSSTSSLERDFIRVIGRLGDERRHFVRAILPELERIQDTKWSWDLVRGDKRDFHDGFWAKSIGDLWCYPSNRGFFDISRSSQAHAWFLLTVARDGLVWYCREHFSQVPSSDRQATGIFIIAGLIFHLVGPATSREQQGDLVQHLLRSTICASSMTPGSNKHSRQSIILCKLSVECATSWFVVEEKWYLLQETRCHKSSSQDPNTNPRVM